MFWVSNKSAMGLLSLNAVWCKNISTWAAAIRASPAPEEAIHRFAEMQRRRIPIDSFASLFAIKACSLLADLSLLRHLHAHLLRIGLRSHVYVGSALLNAYIITCFEDGRQLFDEMPERNIVTWNTMITGYCKSGDMDGAGSLFNIMPDKNVASWSTMIAGYMNTGKGNQGRKLFREMMNLTSSPKPDHVTMVNLLSGCTNSGSLGLLGKSIHAYSARNGIEMSTALGTALIDMYAKCGFLRCAYQVFKRMQERNVQTWSAMICGLALHGYGKEALCVFEKMKDENVRPNEFTFTGILSACSHAGLVDEGYKNFRSMTEEYKLEPRIHHYGCMVDLLGRAGQLEEAYNLVQTMKLRPNVVVWGSLLGACKIHKNVKMGERVIEHVLRVADPGRDGGVFTLISNLYASGGCWNDAESVRKLMVERHVKKNAGSSLIEVCN